jgi:hypothetical protein
VRTRLLELEAGELAIRRAPLVADCEAQELREHLLSLRDAGTWDVESTCAIGYPWDEDHWRQIGEAANAVVRRLSDGSL